MIALGFAEVLGDVGGEDREAEESAGGDGGGHDIVGVKGNRSDEAGCEASCGMGIETCAHPDYEVAKDEEGSGGGENSAANTQHGGLAAQHLVAKEADGRVPGPGDHVGAEMEGIAVGEDGEVIVSRHKGEHGNDGLPAAAAGSEEEESSTDGGEAHAGGGEEVGEDAAENGEEKDEIGSHGNLKICAENRAF